MQSREKVHFDAIRYTTTLVKRLSTGGRFRPMSALDRSIEILPHSLFGGLTGPLVHPCQGFSDDGFWREDSARVFNKMSCCVKGNEIRNK
jgi:hypothetical protein